MIPIAQISYFVDEGSFLYYSGELYVGVVTPLKPSSESHFSLDVSCASPKSMIFTILN